MTYTEIFSFDKDGNAHLAGEVKNAWRGAMAIWIIMEERHLPPFTPEYVKVCNWYHPGITPEEVERRLGYKPTRIVCFDSKENTAQEIWDLAENPDIPLQERIVMFTTFDNCLVKKENIGRVIEAFRAFEGQTSLKEQADILEKLDEDPDVIAVGWNGTSVYADNWANAGGYDAVNDATIPYNCMTGDKHYWLFDELEGKLEAKE